MIIGIDGNEANVEKKVGIGEYAFEILRQFSQIDAKKTPPSFSVYLKNLPRLDMPKESSSWQYRLVKPKKLWTQIGLPFDLYTHRPRPHVFFSPTHYAPRFSPVPTAISIMDLSYMIFPEMFTPSDLYQLRHWTHYSAKNASAIFTISQASKNDIIKLYSIPEEKIHITYPGIKHALYPMSNTKTYAQLQQKYGLSDQYILFVGTLQPRKNIVRLIEAYSQLKKQAKEKNVDLVIIGKKGWLYEDILSAPKKYGVEKDVKFLEFIADDELSIFYKNALFYVLPSLYEGFGLPVLEAMREGCPVITSNVSSLPEAGGDAAMYVDPESVSDIVEKMLELSNNRKLREEMREKGYKQVKKFSWEKTAEQTLAVLEEVGKRK